MLILFPEPSIKASFPEKLVEPGIPLLFHEIFVRNVHLILLASRTRSPSLPSAPPSAPSSLSLRHVRIPCPWSLSKVLAIPETRALRKSNARQSLELHLPSPLLSQHAVVLLIQARHVQNILNGIALDSGCQRALVKQRIAATASAIEQRFPFFFDRFPRLLLGRADRSISLDALAQTADGALVTRSRRQFHELQVFNTPDRDAVEAVQGVGVVADVEEDFGNDDGLEDCFQGCAGGACDCEGLFAQTVDVDEVDCVAWFDEDGDQRERPVSGEVVAFEVDEEAWPGAV